MHKFKSEQEIRDHVGLLKNFYGEVTAYLFLNAAFVILWLLAGGGYFWPIWPIIVWFVSLAIKASKLKIIDEALYQHCCAFRDKLPFIKSDWTEERVKEFLVYLKVTPTTSAAPAAKTPVASKPVAKPTVRKPVSKSIAKKPVAAKPAARKAAPKRSPVKKAPPRKK